MKRIDILEKEKDIRNWISEHLPKAYICRKLKCRPGTLNIYLSKLKINYSGNMGGKGQGGKRKHVSFYLKKDGPFINSHQLKNILIRDGLKEHQCERCHLKKWLKKSIPLELHHVDGDKSNDALENLKLFCPNCHSETDNNSGKANKR